MDLVRIIRCLVFEIIFILCRALLLVLLSIKIVDVFIQFIFNGPSFSFLVDIVFLWTKSDEKLCIHRFVMKQGRD